MDREGAIEKIRKCLALSGSPNENEAKVALEMARKLMAEYRVSDTDFKDEYPEERKTPITFTTIRDSWIIQLSQLIGERFRCKAFTLREYHKKTRSVAFLGFPSDLEICIPAFELAVQTIRTTNQILKHSKAESDNYARGFINGLARAYKNQDSVIVDTMALVDIMSVPQEVIDYADEHFTTDKVKCRGYEHNQGAYDEGYKDGVNHLSDKLDPHKRRLPPNGKNLIR